MSLKANKSLSALLDQPEMGSILEDIYSLPIGVMEVEIDFLRDDFVAQVVDMIIHLHCISEQPCLVNQIKSEVSLDDVKTIFELNIISVEKLLIKNIIHKTKKEVSKDIYSNIAYIDEVCLKHNCIKYSSTRKIDDLFHLYKKLSSVSL